MLSLSAFGQTPAFEVADVKLNNSGEARMIIDLQPGGKLTMRNVPMKVMIVFAYHLRPEALSGPAWLDTARYDVVAKALEIAPPEDVRRMMQTLLAERFHLATHSEQKLMAAWALTLGKSGSKLQPSEPAAVLSAQRCTPGDAPPGQRHVECRHVPTSFLADYLQELAPRDFTVPVVDQTGLKGVFDFKLDWVPRARPDPNAPTDPGAESGPSIFDAVEVQLGLKLESRKLPLPVIVVDRVDREPAGN
jgi:uncharacterized protein (TIGR03435 family)